MKVIVKKVLSEYFQPVKYREKNFEIRKDEDEIDVGDILVLKEWTGNDYTGKLVKRTVKFVLRNVPEYGLMPGYCIIGW